MGDLGDLGDVIARPSIPKVRCGFGLTHSLGVPFPGPSFSVESLMMKRQVFAAAVLGFAVWFSATPAQALGLGLFKKKGDCAPPCATAAVGCGAVAACGGCDATAPCAPTPAPAPAMTTQTVTRYVAKTTTETKDVTTSSYQWVDEKFTYQECVTTSKVEKKPVTTSSYQWVDEKFTYQECVTTSKVEKKPVTTTTYAWVDEAYTYNVCTPVTTMVQKPVCRTVCVPTQVAYTVSHTHKVCVPVCGVDRCGCPTVSYRNERVTTCETCYKTVMQRQTVTEMVSCPVTTYVNTPTKGMQKVCKAITATKDMDVTTYSNAMVNKEGIRKVCKLITVTKDMDVTTYSNAMVNKEGMHKVCKLVTKTEKLPVTTTSYVAVTDTIQVPVTANYGMTGACGSSACGADDCDDGKKGCKLFGRMKGLFGKKSSCGCN